MKVSGIYKIESRIKPERCYIGSARNISHRWVCHLSELRKNEHGNKRLQNHYNKYGESDLQFSILLGCDAEDLTKTEQYFLDSYNPYFNICKRAGNCLGVKHTKEAKENMRNAHLGKRASEETKQKMRNRRHTEEQKEQVRKSMIGKNTWSNHPHTKEHNEKVSKAIKLWWDNRKQEVSN